MCLWRGKRGIHDATICSDRNVTYRVTIGVNNKVYMCAAESRNIVARCVTSRYDNRRHRRDINYQSVYSAERFL